MKKYCVFAVFFSVFILLNGCDDTVPPAPVVNGWYQKNAASDFYVVQPDDTIYSIAFAFGLDYRALVFANHLQPPYVIHAGERLRMTHQPPGQYHIKPKSIESASIASRQIVSRASTYTHTHTAWHWPVAGRVIRTFSRSASGHPGIAIAGKLGEPVRAAASGVVVYSGDGVRGYGNLIIIKHNEAYLSAYAFNQENLVIVGDRVRAGTVIAHMGRDDAGRTLLYFEIRHNGAPENPLRYVG